MIYNDAVGVSDTVYAAKIGKKDFAEVELHGIERITMEEIFPGIKFPYSPFPKYISPDLDQKQDQKLKMQPYLYQTLMIILKETGPIAVLMRLVRNFLTMDRLFKNPCLETNKLFRTGKPFGV